MALRIGRSLLSLRLKEAKKTQLQLAEHLGIRQSYISRVANNEKVFSLEQAANAARFLGCTIEDLYLWQEIP